MARPSSKDPLDKFRWSITIDGFTRLGFASCDVPGYSVQTKPYPEGGQHLFPKQIVDSVTFKPVTLTRGVTADLSFHSWATQALIIARGVTSDGKSPLEARRNVTIKHLNRKGETVKAYTLINAMPIEYEVASGFSSDADDMLSMEKLVLTYESFTVDSAERDSNPLDPRDIIKRMIRRI